MHARFSCMKDASLPVLIMMSFGCDMLDGCQLKTERRRKSVTYTSAPVAYTHLYHDQPFVLIGLSLKRWTIVWMLLELFTRPFLIKYLVIWRRLYHGPILSVDKVV